jgi:hypothetical protein
MDKPGMPALSAKHFAVSSTVFKQEQAVRSRAFRRELRWNLSLISDEKAAGGGPEAGVEGRDCIGAMGEDKTVGRVYSAR